MAEEQVEEEQQEEQVEEEESVADDDGGDKEPMTETRVEDIVKDKIKEALGVGTKKEGKVAKGSDASVVHEAHTEAVGEATTGPPEGLVEQAVHKVLAAKEHEQEHERLTKATDTPPRPRRKGIARFIFGE